MMKLRATEGLSFLLIAIGFLLIVGVGWLRTFMPELSPAQFWLGQRGVIELLTGLGTVAAASVAGFFAYRSYAMNRETNILARFQQGAEMLADGRVSVNVAGCHVLYRLALEDDRYLMPAIHALVSSVMEKSEFFMHRYFEFLAENKTLHVREAYSERYPPCPFTIVQALSSIGLISSKVDEWKDSIAFMNGNRLQVANGYINTYDFWNETFRRMRMQAFVVKDVSFISCTFVDCHIQLWAEGDLVFENCVFVDCDIEVRDTAERLPAEPRFNAEFSMLGGTYRNTRLNGRELHAASSST